MRIYHRMGITPNIYTAQKYSTHTVIAKATNAAFMNQDTDTAVNAGFAGI